MKVRMKIDGRLRAPTVSCPGEGSAGIGISGDHAAVLPNQPGELRGDLLKTGAKFIHGGSLVLKADSGIFNIGPIDGKNLIQILYGCDSYCHNSLPSDLCFHFIGRNPMSQG